MSAGGLSYDLLTTSRKATLPSVEMWNTNMNILRDPNSGIYTRRVDKVGDTQGVLLAQDNAGDRIAECINVYARGVNPMVSVSYDNNSNNAGLRGSLLNRNQGVKLPYRPEVYRPPVFRQEDLMPLSRQPRNWFYALANPELPNIIQNMQCNESKSSTIDKLLHVEGPPSYHKNIELPQFQDPPKNFTHDDKSAYEVTSNIRGVKQGHDEFRDILRAVQKRALQDRMNVSAFSTKSKTDQNSLVTPEVIQRVRDEILHLKDIIATASFQEKDGESDRSAANHINNNKLSYEILTQKIKRLEQIFFNGKGKVRDDILHYETQSTPSFLDKDSENRGFTTPSYSVRAEYLTTEAHTQPTSSYQLNADNEFSEVPFIVPGDRLGTWVVGNSNKSFRGTDVHNHDHVLQASKPVSSTCYDARPTSQLHYDSTDIATAHNVRNITPLDVTSSKTLAAREEILHHNTIDRSMKNKRPLGSAEVNHQYNTKTIIHDNISSGRIEQNRTPIEAHSQKTSYDKRGDMGERNLERRILLVDTTTKRDIEADGTNLYNVQSRNGQTYVNNKPFVGGFHSIGNSIPRMDLPSTPSEMPIDSQWTNVKREAYRQQQSRFS